MTPFWSFWRSKSSLPPSPPPPQQAPELVALSLAFVEGFRYALGAGGQALQEAIKQEATEEALRQLEPTIVKRAEALKAIRPRDLVALQAKIQEFQSKYARTQEVKYQHYVEALTWALPTPEDPAGH